MTHLEIGGSAGLDEDIEKQLRMIEEESAPLYNFYFECSALNAEQTMALAKILQKHHLTLGEVEFNAVKLELEGVQILSAALATMPSLETIKFIQCGICDECAKVLADMCVQMKALKEMCGCLRTRSESTEQELSLRHCQAASGS